MTLVPGLRHYLAVFLLSLSLLMLEITVARMLSVALLSHYAFVAISLAMFGMGVSGLVVYLFPNHFTVDKVDAQIVSYSWRFGLSAALGVLAFLHIHVTQALSLPGFLTLSLGYGVLAVPFFCGGLCISLLMTHFSSHIARIYYADLVGASLGCLGVVLAMQAGSAPLVALHIAALVAVATVCVALTAKPRRLLAPALSCAVVLLLLVLGLTTDLFRMRYVKNWTEFYSDYEVWNAFSRLSAFDSEKFFGPGSNAVTVLPVKGKSEDYKGGAYPKTMVLDIDGAAWTPMMNFDGNLGSIQFLRESVLYAAHHAKPGSDVLVIGIGGGRDLLAALVFGQKSVTGIEINPLMRHIVEERYGDYSGHPYTRDGVTVLIDEARSRLSRLDRKFDIIQLSLIDTFSLNASGGFVFSENYLYTREAFQEYFRHLNGDGILTLTRYFIPAYPIEILRLLAMAREAWALEGIGDIAQHVVVLNQGINATMMVKRSPFNEAELQQVEKSAAEHGMGVLYRPGSDKGHPEIRTLITTATPREFMNGYPFIIEPPVDDRPFFFNFLRNRQVDVSVDPFEFLKHWRDALSLMYLLIAVVTSMAVLFLVGPLLLLRRKAGSNVRAGVAVPLLLYFACLGYGFMMIEIPLLQRFMLFLGYPVYALAVVLFGLLLFSGTGSLLSGRFTAQASSAVIVLLVSIILVSLTYAYFLPPIISALLGATTLPKIFATVLLLAPIGLLLGMAYPLGIAVLRQFGEGLVPWAWGLNGAMSVVASVLAIFVGSRLGFTIAFLTGVAAYGIALVSMRVAIALAPVSVGSQRGKVIVEEGILPT